MHKLLPKEEFWSALESARQPSHSGLHPFSGAWAAGELTRDQLGEWAVQHYYYIRPVPQHFALLYSRLPDLDARQHLLENMLGEEMPEQPEKRHPELLVKFGMACGKTRDYIVGGEDDNRILPTTRAMAAWTWELTAIRHVSEACAGIMVALEGQLPTLFPKYVAAMQRMGFSDENLEFFHVHIEGDVEHAQTGLELTARYADTPDRQKRALNIVRATAELRYSMLNGIFDKLVAGKAA